MDTKTPTYLAIPEDVRRMAGMAAARAGQSLSEYIADLIRKDSDETGIATLVKGKEVSNGQSA